LLIDGFAPDVGLDTEDEEEEGGTRLGGLSLPVERWLVGKRGLVLQQTIGILFFISHRIGNFFSFISSDAPGQSLNLTQVHSFELLQLSPAQQK
jgi:hypothetical protein